MLGAVPLGAASARTAPDHAGPTKAPSTTDTVDQHAGHNGAGLVLVAATEGDDPPGSTCARNAPVREERIAALDVDITLNRYGDHDPEGRMFAREDDVQRVRDEEQRNAAARTGGTDVAVTAGLQGDAIQPLVLRVLPGECLRVVLRNALTDGDAASFHVHGAGMQVVGGGPDSASNSKAIAPPGASVTYEWQVPSDEPEGTHYFHSAGNDREQTDHGLFGALIVEPAGSKWLDPRSGTTATSGWDAIVTVPDQPAFREFTLIYHEVGDETYQVRDRTGAFIPLVDSITQAYRPDGRALNYRSEPFSDRLQLGEQLTGRVDESLAYSSYAFGDPATPVMRTYLGEPVKQRVVHGGDEVFHVHHVHGGSIRWPRQPGAEPKLFGDELDKRPALVPDASERTDSQSIGPSETFDVADECASGGCQQAAGDFLYHCHIASHYFAGMWGLWRVYNTLQDGAASTDTMPALQPVPDRTSVVPAVSTAKLSPEQRQELVTEQVPPQGVPKLYDASVWDWQWDGDRLLGEREASTSWPGYRSPTPGARREVLVDPTTGRLAYPFLRPHLAQRPPFAPNHGPAPYLDPTANGADPPAPGAAGPASTCPAGSKLKHFDINAIKQPVPLNAANGLVDGDGELFVLRQQEDRARSDPALQVPLAIRANAGEDCVDILLRNEVDDGGDQPFSKVSLHIHFVQFDPQASDGLDAGFNYEQTIRPYRNTGIQVRQASLPGDTSIVVGDATSFSVGAVVGVGIDQDAAFEVRRIADIQGGRLVFDRPLTQPHGAGEVVSPEFVRYRWFVDAQFGSAYFHDHVDGIHSWERGLFGALIAEPPGSTYTDPHTGETLSSGPIADIHTDARVSADVTGSFRELSLFIQDDKKLNAVGRSTGSAYNLRAEPLSRRTDDPTTLFSSDKHGDPATPMIEANLGDPIVVRSLVGSTNDIHTVYVDGHWFRSEPWSTSSPPIDAIQVGISERYDLVIPAAGGPQRKPGDYLYAAGRPAKLEEGSWGLLRVYGEGEGALKPLPGHERSIAPSTDVCAAGAPARSFAVSAVDVPLPMNDGALGRIYVLDRDVDTVTSGQQQPQPLVLHANVGDCIKVSLTNRTRGAPATYTCFLPADPATTGIGAGHEPSTAVSPGETRTFTYYASPDVGETVALVRDFGNALENPKAGLYGAIVIGARGTTYRGDGWSVDAFPPNAPAYRDVSLFLQDEDQSFGTHRMPYLQAPVGSVGVNYESAPVEERAGASSDVADAYLIDRHGDPKTPIINAYAGDPMRIHVLAPWSEQSQVFAIEGHDWPVEPGRAGSNVVGAQALGGLQAITIEPRGGAGGLGQVAGDYTYGDERGAYREAGMWGLFRVHPRGAKVDGLRALGSSESTDFGTITLAVALIAVLGTMVIIGASGARRRRQRS